MVCGNRIVINKQARLFSAGCSKGDVVAVLKVILKVVCTVWVDERIDKINGEELDSFFDKVLIDVCLWGARTALQRVVCTLFY